MAINNNSFCYSVSLASEWKWKNKTFVVWFYGQSVVLRRKNLVDWGQKGKLNGWGRCPPPSCRAAPDHEQRERARKLTKKVEGNLDDQNLTSASRASSHKDNLDMLNLLLTADHKVWWRLEKNHSGSREKAPDPPAELDSFMTGLNIQKWQTWAPFPPSGTFQYHFGLVTLHLSLPGSSK